MSTDLTHTLRAEDEVTEADELAVPMTLEEIQSQRMVRTNDKRGVPYSFGNRTQRRNVGRKGHAGSQRKPKQFHKIGH